MGFLKNKKAVEALPLRYIIIALVAALVVGIVLQFTGTLNSSIQDNAEVLDESLTERTVCELDNDMPRIVSASAECSGAEIDISADVLDECGVDSVWAYVKEDSETLSSVTLRMNGMDDRNSSWDGSNTNDEDYPSSVSVYIYAKDKSTSENAVDSQDKAYEILEVSCD